MRGKAGVLPKRWQGLLWSADIKTLDLEKDRVYIIHQVLNYGDLTDWRLLFKLYPKQTIKQVFSRHPYRNYRPARFNLVKNSLLGIEESLDERKYVAILPKHSR